MSAAEVAFVFILVWWLTLFVVLPLGVRHTENPEPGHEAGAPANPRLWRKGLVVTASAALLTAAVYVAAEAGWLPLREWLTATPPTLRRDGPGE